jgi:hypothetical protein
MSWTESLSADARNCMSSLSRSTGADCVDPALLCRVDQHPLALLYVFLACSTPFCCVRIYHMWWKQRGDVFRVLSSLCK